MKEQDIQAHMDSPQRLGEQATASTVVPDPTMAAVKALVLEATAAAEEMRLVDFNERRQEFFCRVCRYKSPFVGDPKLHDDNCQMFAFVRAMGKLHALVTGQPNYQSPES